MVGIVLGWESLVKEDYYYYFLSPRYFIPKGLGN